MSSWRSVSIDILWRSQLDNSIAFQNIKRKVPMRVMPSLVPRTQKNILYSGYGRSWWVMWWLLMQKLSAVSWSWYCWWSNHSLVVGHTQRNFRYRVDKIEKRIDRYRNTKKHWIELIEQVHPPGWDLGQSKIKNHSSHIIYLTSLLTTHYHTYTEYRRNNIAVDPKSFDGNGRTADGYVIAVIEPRTAIAHYLSLSLEGTSESPRNENRWSK